MTPFESGGRVDAAHDELSDLLEDPDASNESIRDAAVRLCEALVAEGGTMRPKSETAFDGTGGHTPGPWHVEIVDGEWRFASAPSLLAERDELRAALEALLECADNYLGYDDAGRTETRWTARDGIAEAGEKAVPHSLRVAANRARSALAGKGAGR